MSQERTERERIASLEDKTGHHDKQIENLQAHLGVTEKLTVMYEQQQALAERVQESNDKQFQYFKEQLDKQHDRDEKFIVSLNDISENMMKLNYSVKENQRDTADISDRVGVLEKEKQLKKEAVRGWLKDMFFKFVIPLTIFLITGYLAYIIGWK